jgi:integrase
VSSGITFFYTFKQLGAIVLSTMISANPTESGEITPKGCNVVATERRLHFTKRSLERLPVPAGQQRAYFWDDEVRGLCVGIGHTGRKFFVFCRKIGGKTERIRLGEFPHRSVEQARAAASELNAAIGRGENPADQRRTLRAEATLGELFELYATEHGRERRSWSRMQNFYDLHLQRWHLRRLSSISKPDVVRLHAHIGKTRGRYVANRCVELLSAMYNHAREWGWTGTNPAAGVKAFKERKRARFLGAGELPLFFQSLMAEENFTIRDYVLVSLLTGARKGNVLEMRWEEIDWRSATWTIPAEKAKAEEDIDVVLTPVVLQILRSRKESSLSPWVFPGKGQSGHLIEAKTGWHRILKRAGLTNLRIHDLRRSLGSWMAAGGASLPIIGKSLGHQSLEATRIYARLDLDPVRAAVAQATNAMLLAGGVAGLLEGENE